jgi:rhodanese-related sulfurtransferase
MITKEKTAESQTVKNVFPLEAHELITNNGEDIVVLDVCSPKEFEIAHIEGAINIDYFSKLFKARLGTLDRDKTYFVYCRMGARSTLALKIMKSLGFRRVYNILGGTLLWEEEGLPFATGRGPSKWVVCPFSITFILSMKAKKALRFVYVASADFLKSIFYDSAAIVKRGNSDVQL